MAKRTIFIDTKKNRGKPYSAKNHVKEVINEIAAMKGSQQTQTMQKHNAYLQRSLLQATKVQAQLMPQPKQNMNQRTNTNMQDYAQQLTDQTISGTFATTPAVVRFARVYSDPFLIDSARLPVLPQLPSQLIRTYASGTGLTNSTGLGWIACAPAPGVVNDKTQGFYSSAAGAPNTIAYSGTGVSEITSGSSYASTNFYMTESSNLVFRIVSYGIRARYLGTTLNAAGTCYTLQMTPGTPNNELNNFGLSAIKAYPNFKEYTFRDSRWHSVTRHIRFQEDFKYQGYAQDTLDNFAYAISGANATERSFDAAPSMCIYLQAQPEQPFEWEVVGHYELVGPDLERLSVVNVKTDHVEKVISAYAKVREKDTKTPDHSVGVADGWVGTLKKGVDLLLPMVPEILAALF